MKSTPTPRTTTPTVMVKNRPSTRHPARSPQHFHPHAPGWAINFVLATLAISALIVGFGAWPFFNRWAQGMIEHASTSLAFGHGHAEHATFFGYDPHQAMMVASTAV